jgi:hypothetical protein
VDDDDDEDEEAGHWETIASYLRISATFTFQVQKTVGSKGPSTHGTVCSPPPVALQGQHHEPCTAELDATILGTQLCSLGSFN